MRGRAKEREASHQQNQRSRGGSRRGREELVCLLYSDTHLPFTLLSIQQSRQIEPRNQNVRYPPFRTCWTRSLSMKAFHTKVSRKVAKSEWRRYCRTGGCAKADAPSRLVPVPHATEAASGIMPARLLISSVSPQPPLHCALRAYSSVGGTTCTWWDSRVMTVCRVDERSNV